MTGKEPYHRMNDSRTAVLSSSGRYTSFSCGGHRIRFRTSDKLNRYLDVRQWDNGYLVVTADYSTLGTVEEYIDLTPILEHLLFDPAEFLKPIKEVVVRYD